MRWLIKIYQDKTAWISILSLSQRKHQNSAPVSLRTTASNNRTSLYTNSLDALPRPVAKGFLGVLKHPPPLISKSSQIPYVIHSQIPKFTNLVAVIHSLYQLSLIVQRKHWQFVDSFQFVSLLLQQFSWRPGPSSSTAPGRVPGRSDVETSAH